MGRRSKTNGGALWEWPSPKIPAPGALPAFFRSWALAERLQFPISTNAGGRMGVLITIIIGFFVGLFARFLKPGNDQMGIIMTTLLGIAGAFVGGYLGQVFGIYQPGEPVGFFGSVIGAILVLMVASLMFRGRRSAI
jgi:uncharacterized membrane protein YeaQ/YmgE (transglycosylase-associated protein family)